MEKAVVLTVNNKGNNIKFTEMSKYETKSYNEVSITIFLKITPIKDYVPYDMVNATIIQIIVKR